MKVKVETKRKSPFSTFLRLVFQAFKHSMYFRKMLSPGERRIIKPIVVLVKEFHCLPNVLVISVIVAVVLCVYLMNFTFDRF